jgi:predicted porin
MKKHLIAAAVASVLAVPAFAQSNVSIYGRMDAGIQTWDSGSTSFTRGVNSGLLTSLWGLRGTEDLGGGLKANFQLEGALNTQDGTLGTSTTNQIFNREAWVGLSGGFGEIRLGRQDVNRTQDVDIDTSQAGLLGLAPRIGGTDDQLGNDQSGVVKYISPSFSGFQFQVGYTSGNVNADSTDSKAQQQGASFSYNSGPLRVVGGVHKIDAFGTAATTNSKRDLTALGASYDFGMVSVGAFTQKADVNLAGEIKSNSISARVPLGDGLALHGVYQTSKISNVANAKGDGYTLALTKALSKRTTIYGAYTDVDNKSGGTMTMHGTNLNNAPVAGRDPNAFTVGVMHNF